MLTVVSVFGLASCGAASTSPTAAPSSAASPAATVASSGCEVRPGGASGPVTAAGGPFFHQVVVAETTDGVHVTRPVQVLDHASVPDAVRTPDGRVLVYYVNGQDGGVSVARLDGQAAQALAPVTIDGVLGPAGIVDPDATRLPDGRIRLAYLSGFGPPGGGTRAFCLADSTDGLSFRSVGRALALSDEQSTDPSLLRLLDGSWLLAYSRGQTSVLARSADGLTFETYATLGLGGVPELATTADGAVRIYACSSAGIVSAVSRDAGRTFTAEATVVPPGTLGKRTVCDPSLVEGAGLFVFKTAD